ncbi:MAG: hypothetical protein AW09_004280 [Candidatus Accumulibacter phosphatis]|uniref:Uncharacterized protein n=1 Tax=Candidatus Accumulibacter phosphatis TaxID=327160 RepID=A0A080LR34_9PROT|nr:MAG: hypothetical protein AW09_004280 [Candidatus Accumulibacter phosphatis]
MTASNSASRLPKASDRSVEWNVAKACSVGCAISAVQPASWIGVLLPM